MSKREGFTIVPNHIVGDRRLTERQRVVLEALMSFRAKGTGHVFRNRDRIAERCGLAPTTVSGVLNQLARSGYIKIKRNRRGCNDYWFLFDFHDWSCPVGNGIGGQEVTESVTSRGLEAKEPLPRGNGNDDQDVTELTSRCDGIRYTPTDHSTDPFSFSKKRKREEGSVRGETENPPTDSDATPEPTMPTPKPKAAADAITRIRERLGTNEPPPPPQRKPRPIAPSGTLTPAGDIARRLTRLARP